MRYTATIVPAVIAALLLVRSAIALSRVAAVVPQADNDYFWLLEQSCKKNDVAIIVLDSAHHLETSILDFLEDSESLELVRDYEIFLFWAAPALIRQSSDAISERFHNVAGEKPCVIQKECFDRNCAMAISIANLYSLEPESLCNGENAVVDEEEQLFLSLNTPRDWEDIIDSNESAPIFTAGTPLGNVALLRLADYTMDWKSLFHDRNDQQSTPHVFIALYHHPHTPFVSHMIATLHQQTLQKGLVTLWIASSDVEQAIQLSEYVSDEYANVVLVHESLTEAEARHQSVDVALHSTSEFYVWWDTSVHVTAPTTLSSAIGLRLPLVAPAIHAHDNYYTCNYWGNVSDSGYYTRSWDCLEMYEGKKTGVWNVPYVSKLLVFSTEALRMHRSEYLVEGPAEDEEDFDIEIAFAIQLRREGLFMFADNRMEYGYWVSRTHNPPPGYNVDIYQSAANADVVEQLFMAPQWRMSTSTRLFRWHCEGAVLESEVFTPALIEALRDEWQQRIPPLPRVGAATALDLNWVSEWEWLANTYPIRETFALHMGASDTTQDVVVDQRIMLHLVMSDDGDRVVLEEDRFRTAPLHVILPLHGGDTPVEIEVTIEAIGLACRWQPSAVGSALFVATPALAGAPNYRFIARPRDTEQLQEAFSSGYLVFPFYYAGSRRPPPTAITVTTHNSLEEWRLHRSLLLLRGGWEGHLSLAVTVRLTAANTTAGGLRRWLATLTDSERERVDIHLIVDPYSPRQRRYGQNLGRLVSIAFAPTEFAVLVDGDTYFTRDMNEYLQGFLPLLVDLSIDWQDREVYTSPDPRPINADWISWRSYPLCKVGAYPTGKSIHRQ